MVFKCPKCGGSIANDRDQCPHCDTPLSVSEKRASAAVPAAVVSPAQSRNRARWIERSIWLGVVIVVGWVAYTQGTHHVVMEVWTRPGQDFDETKWKQELKANQERQAVEKKADELLFKKIDVVSVSLTRSMDKNIPSAYVAIKVTNNSDQQLAQITLKARAILPGRSEPFEASPFPMTLAFGDDLKPGESQIVNRNLDLIEWDELLTCDQATFDKVEMVFEIQRLVGPTGITLHAK